MLIKDKIKEMGKKLVIDKTVKLDYDTSTT